MPIAPRQADGLTATIKRKKVTSRLVQPRLSNCIFVETNYLFSLVFFDDFLRTVL
jgi:hypothetical protein